MNDDFKGDILKRIKENNNFENDLMQVSKVLYLSRGRSLEKASQYELVEFATGLAPDLKKELAITYILKSHIDYLLDSEIKPLFFRGYFDLKYLDAFDKTLSKAKTIASEVFAKEQPLLEEYDLLASEHGYFTKLLGQDYLMIFYLEIILYLKKLYEVFIHDLVEFERILNEFFCKKTFSYTYKKGGIFYLPIEEMFNEEDFNNVKFNFLMVFLDRKAAREIEIDLGTTKHDSYIELLKEVHGFSKDIKRETLYLPRFDEEHFYFTKHICTNFDYDRDKIKKFKEYLETDELHAKLIDVDFVKKLIMPFRPDNEIGYVKDKYMFSLYSFLFLVFSGTERFLDKHNDFINDNDLYESFRDKASRSYIKIFK